MPRRRQSGFKPIHLVATAAVALVGFGGYKMFGKSDNVGGGFEGVAKLSPKDYFHNNASVQGNTYQITATVGERIHATDEGRIYALLAKENSEEIPMTALFTSKFANDNVQVGQELILKVQVDRTGVLRVQEIKRS